MSAPSNEWLELQAGICEERAATISTMTLLTNSETYERRECLAQAAAYRELVRLRRDMRLIVMGANMSRHELTREQLLDIDEAISRNTPAPKEGA